MGPQQLPYIYLLSAVITLLGAFILDKLLNRFAPVRLIPTVLTLFTALILTFWWLFTFVSQMSSKISFILYLFISLFAVVGVSLFWATCNDTHSPKEGRSFYNIIGLGGILGGLAGSETTNLLATKIGTENLLLISAGILALTIPLPHFLISEWHRENKLEHAPLITKKSDEKVEGNVKPVFNMQYILIITGLVFIFTLMSSLLDFQYQTIIKNADISKDLRTAFFGRIFIYINIAGILIHILFTWPILKWLGPAGGLLPLPIIALAGSLVLWLFPDIDTVTMIWALYGGVAYSLNQVTRETLYLRIPRHLRYRAKFYNDTFVYRFGDAAAAFIILASYYLLNVPNVIYLGYDLLFGFFWIGLVIYFFYKFLRKKNNCCLNSNEMATEAQRHGEKREI
jgi:AAA family ATP:ADP antiporter